MKMWDQYRQFKIKALVYRLFNNKQHINEVPEVKKENVEGVLQLQEKKRNAEEKKRKWVPFNGQQAKWSGRRPRDGAAAERRFFSSNVLYVIDDYGNKYTDEFCVAWDCQMDVTSYKFLCCLRYIPQGFSTEENSYMCFSCTTH